MGRKNFLITALICGAMMCVAITGCTNEDKLSDDTLNSLNSETENIQLRSDALGFIDVADYQAYVVQQCAAGNHENCCFLSSGTHQICASPNHLGINCNGAYRKGGNHKGLGNNCSNCKNSDCTGFVDANGDGICDNHTQGNNCTNPNCAGFVDANGDGICDNHGQGSNCTNPNCTGFVDANDDGICDNHAQGNNCTYPNCTGFVDANGDGICDNHAQGNNCTYPNCTGFVDANGDGICDNHTGNGSGNNGNGGNGNGGHGKRR